MYLRLLILLCLGIELCKCCDITQTRQGCRIENRMCTCGFGCRSDYRYENLLQCQTALRGKRNDICFPNPCLHGGSCIQISQQPGFKCRCEGTGYFGSRCNRACPIPGAASIGERVFPYECIVI